MAGSILKCIKHLHKCALTYSGAWPAGAFARACLGGQSPVSCAWPTAGGSGCRAEARYAHYLAGACTIGDFLDVFVCG